MIFRPKKPEKLEGKITLSRGDKLHAFEKGENYVEFNANNHLIRVLVEDCVDDGIGGKLEVFMNDELTMDAEISYYNHIPSIRKIAGNICAVGNEKKVFYNFSLSHKPFSAYYRLDYLKAEKTKTIEKCCGQNNTGPKI